MEHLLDLIVFANNQDLLNKFVFFHFLYLLIFIVKLVLLLCHLILKLTLLIHIYNKLLYPMILKVVVKLFEFFIQA